MSARSEQAAMSRRSLPCFQQNSALSGSDFRLTRCWGNKALVRGSFSKGTLRNMFRNVAEEKNLGVYEQ